MKGRYLISTIVIILLHSAGLSAFESKGPLTGKNYYAPFLIFYSFPGIPAATEGEGELSLSIAQYYVQDIVTEFHLIEPDILIQERFIDYEGYIFEPTLSFCPMDSLEIGLTGRLHFYYGGIFDSFFESFHQFFGFPNGGREAYPRNDVYINIQTTSGISLSLNDSAVSIGDTDLFAKWNFLSTGRRGLDLSLLSALKLPTGSADKVGGSGSADLAFGLLADFRFFERFPFYIQNGIILPGRLMAGYENHPLPIYHLLASLEFILSDSVSLLGQFRFNTSPIAEGVTIPENIEYTVKLVKPMTNLMFGAVFRLSEYRMQLYFEEDAFTNNGADLIVNFTIGRSFSLY